MDNIQKLVLGVLSVAGLLAFLTPTGMDSQPPDADPAVEVAASAPPSPSPVMDAEMPEFEESEMLEEGEEPFKFGEPTIDGKPLGESDEADISESLGPQPNQSAMPGNMSPNFQMPGTGSMNPQMAMPNNMPGIQPSGLPSMPNIQQHSGH